MSRPDVSVVICAHNPDRARLLRVLQALAVQDLDAERFEVIIVDNGSCPALAMSDAVPGRIARLSIVAEPELGLSHARARGFAAASADCVVLVDDDNALSPNYLSLALRFFNEHTDIGAIGGPCVAEFDGPVPDWATEFLPLLALRDLGNETLLHSGHLALSQGYPSYSPIGAGMALRTRLARDWAATRRSGTIALTDRRGTSLTSAGDNDIVLHILRQNLGVAYVPGLRVTHLLSCRRLSPEYLMRLNEGIQSSWMRVLSRHDANPWPPISRLGAWLRIIRAWFRMRPWRGPIERIRFAGVKGHFLGRCL